MTRHSTFARLCVAVVAVAVMVGSGVATRAKDAEKAAKPALPPIDSPHLHNAYRVTDKVLSGAQPEGEPSFKALADLGVRTIISVDGAKPDVVGARKHGLRYVHLPIGYDGVEAEEGRAIAKALAELPGPIYIHCHHGKHRSAAAVAVACVMNGTLPPDKAEAVLRTFSTGENYKGLWTDSRNARPLAAAELEKVSVEYVETAKVPPMAEAMIEIDQRFDRLKLIRQSNWGVPKEHPALDPAHEALQLQELLFELARTGDVAQRPHPFREMLLQSEADARAVRDALAADPPDHPRAAAAFERINASCKSCHKAFRDE